MQLFHSETLIDMLARLTFRSEGHADRATRSAQAFPRRHHAIAEALARGIRAGGLWPRNSP